MLGDSAWKSFDFKMDLTQFLFYLQNINNE